MLTFLGLRSVTLLMPGTCFRPSLAIDFRAFFSFLECTVTVEPAGIPPSPASTSESELLEASLTSAPLPMGSSSGSSSIRGFAIFTEGEQSATFRISRFSWIQMPLELPGTSSMRSTVLKVDILTKGNARGVLLTRGIFMAQERPPLSNITLRKLVVDLSARIIGLTCDAACL